MGIRTRNSFYAILLAGLWISAASSAYAGVFKIADTSTPVVGGTGTYSHFDPPDSNAGALPYNPIEVAFRGTGTAGSDGIYYYFNDYAGYLGGGSSLSKVVDKSSTLPGTSETIASISRMSGSTNGEVFQAKGSGGTVGLFYPWKKIAAVGDANPSGGTFTSFEGLAQQWETAAFRTPTGIYRSNTTTATPTIVADTSTPMPGGPSNFQEFGDPAVASTPVGNASFVAFQGQGATGDTALFCQFFTFGTGPTVRLATLGGPVGDCSVNSNSVYVRTSSAIQQIELNFPSPPSITQIAQIGMAVPGAPPGTTFTSFGDYSAGDDFSSTRCVFTATTSSDVQGIYQKDSSPPGLSRLIDTTMPFDGRMPMSFELSRRAVQENHIAFKVNFTDGSSGVYSTDGGPIPEPSMGLAGLALAAACRSLRRRR